MKSLFFSLIIVMLTKSKLNTSPLFKHCDFRSFEQNRDFFCVEEKYT